MLVGLTDVSRRQAVRVMEAPSADAAVVELGHQTVPRDELHQHLLTEELQEEKKEGWRLRTEGSRRAKVIKQNTKDFSWFQVPV